MRGNGSALTWRGLTSFGVRTHLIETARPVMENMVMDVTGVKVLSLHHDISTITGEEVVLFTLADVPVMREQKKR